MEESNQQRNWIIYIHRNKTNGKVYIGQTGTNPETRWHNGLGYKGCSRFEKAITEYGWDGFTHEILLSNLTKDEADEAEIELIQKYNARNPEYGYNIREGGNHGLHSEETKVKMHKPHPTKQGTVGYWHGKKRNKTAREKMSQSHMGKEGYWTGKTRDEETCKKISEHHADFSNGKHPMYGKHWSDKTRKKMSNSQKKRWENTKCDRLNISKAIEKSRKVRSKPVKCIETNTIYSSAAEAKVKTGIDGGNISACCHGKRKTAGGFHWQFVEKELDNQEDI